MNNLNNVIRKFEENIFKFLDKMKALLFTLVITFEICLSNLSLSSKVTPKIFVSGKNSIKWLSISIKMFDGYTSGLILSCDENGKKMA